MVVIDMVEVEVVRSEIWVVCKIFMWLYIVFGNNFGMDWQFVVEEIEDDWCVVGVMNECGNMVMGDCMLDLNNEVMVVDVQFIVFMDLCFVWMVIDLFNLVLEEIDWFSVFEYFVIYVRVMVQKIVKQWEEGVKNE